MEPIDWSQIAILGELTTQGGPFFDDHFLIVVFRSGEILEIPTSEAAQYIPMIENATGFRACFGLCDTTDFMSRIIFPGSLAGHPLFDFCRTERSIRTMLRRIKRLGVAEVSKRFTQEVSEYMKNP